MKRYVTTLLIAISTITYSQVESTESVDTTESSEEWPYSMPIWGKKATEKGYKIQLPYGLNVNYVYNRMDLEITQFGMSIGDDPDSRLNRLIGEYVTLDNLNFTNTIARTNGMNIRADVWVFPFWNLYGLYSSTNGSTEVSLQPEWYNEQGDLVLSLPDISSKVDFTASTWGVGSTFVGKISEGYFFSVDGNISWSSSELLQDKAVFAVASARVGHRVPLSKKVNLSLYVGGMFRDFIDQEGNFGAVALDQALPNIGDKVFSAINDKRDANKEEIAGLNPNNPIDNLRIQKLENQNERLEEIETVFEELISSDVNYDIKKEIINNWSVQFGFNLEINDYVHFRGEFGKGQGNDFVMLGLQYRFGL